MKLNRIIALTITIALLIGAFGCATEKEQEEKLAASAKVSRAEAERIALARVPGGTIKEAEIEKEHGRVIWSVDVATAGTPDITEVHVDAQTSEVLGIEKESPASETKEKKK